MAFFGAILRDDFRGNSADPSDVNVLFKLTTGVN